MRDLMTLVEAVLYSGETEFQENPVEITIWENPSRAEFRKAMAASEYTELRGLWDTGLIIWDAELATHYDMIDWVGNNMSTVIDGADMVFTPDTITMNSFAPDNYDVNAPETIAEAQQMGQTIRATFGKFYPNGAKVILILDGTREEIEV